MTQAFIAFLLFAIGYGADGWESKNVLGLKSLENNRVDEALKYGTESVSENSNPAENFGGYYLVLVINLHKNKADEVLGIVKVLKDANGLKPAQIAFVLVSEGGAYNIQKNYEKAKDALIASLAIHPYSMAQNQLAWLWALGRISLEKDKALELALAACADSKNKNVAYLDTLAAVHARRGDFDNAMTFSRLAVFGADEKQREYLERHMRLYADNKTVDSDD